MSLSYNGTTSALQSSATQSIGTLFSAAGWMKPVTEGNGNVGEMFAHGAFNSNHIQMRWNSGNVKKWCVRSQWGGNAQWDMTTAFAALGVWLWVGCTLDASNVANKPILYTLVGSTFSILTVGSGLTEIGGPSGTIDTSAQTFYLGRENAGSTFDGLLGEFAFWKGIRTPSEMEAIAFNGVNSCPDHFNYLPQDGGSVQNLGNSGTAFTGTNTTAGENPPVRPAGRRG